MSETNALPDMERELRFYPAQNPSPHHLTTTQIEQYNTKGYVFPVDIFDDTEASAQTAYFDSLSSKATAAGLNSYSINGWHQHCRGIWDLATNDRILDHVEDLLGPDLVCTMTHYFAKMPGDQKQVSFHQDASYWPLTPSKVVTVWLAIDNIAADNGPMTFVPASHIHGQIPFDRSTPEEQNVLNQAVHDYTRWGDEPVAVILKAGQASLHTDLLLHGSEPNTSDRRRCGLTLRYHPPDVRRNDPDHASGIICRGSDPSGYWQHTERPENDEVPR
jgi:non-haem Fe2+, alpha-ketoglutarate-dependent halogenase